MDHGNTAMLILMYNSKGDLKMDAPCSNIDAAHSICIRTYLCSIDLHLHPDRCLPKQQENCTSKSKTICDDNVVFLGQYLYSANRESKTYAQNAAVR